MATATTRTRTVTTFKTVPVEEEVPDGVTLHLSKAEAETLCEVAWRIGGQPSRSRRGHIENVANALYKAGVAGPSYEARRLRDDYDVTLTDESRMWFNDPPAGDPARAGLPYI